MPADSSFTGYITQTTNTSQATGSTMFYANDVVWGNWQVYYADLEVKNQIFYTGGTTEGTITTWNTWNTDYEETEESIRWREEHHARLVAEAEIARQRYAEQQRLAEVAQDQANELLIELLSDAQQRTWIEQHFFDVAGSESGRVYRIRSGNTNNVARLSEDGRRRERVFCAHPPDIPDADVNLAQMLLLVTDEPAFLAVANSHPVGSYEEVTPLRIAEAELAVVDAA